LRATSLLPLRSLLLHDALPLSGVRLLPVVDAEGSSTERQIVTGCLALLVVSLLPTLIGLAGAVYFVGAFLMGAAFAALGNWQALDRKSTRLNSSHQIISYHVFC